VTVTPSSVPALPTAEPLMPDVRWSRLSAASLEQLARNDAIVLLPVGATEQHGPHLATGTDTFLCDEACIRTARLVQKVRPIVVAPAVWVGLSEHHMAFGGTFTVSLATWHSILRDLCLSVLRCGFRRIMIVNGHAGNMTALNVLTTELTLETQAAIASTSYFVFGMAKVRDILEDQADLQHACEYETSAMMAIHPDLVDHRRLSDAVGPNMSRASALARPVHVWQSFKEMTSSGVFGDARRASADKGERLLAAVAEDFSSRLIAGEPW